MASAVASNVRAGPAAAGAMSFGWLGPRLSLGARDAAAAASVAEAEEPAAASKAAEPAICKDFIDFEFSLGGPSSTMLPADELFADGKLLPLRPHAAAAAGEEGRRDAALVAEAPAAPEPIRAALDLDPYVFSPKAPTCSSRWRELLRLRKAQTPQRPVPSASASPPASPAAAATPSSRASGSSAARSLKLLLLQRNGGRAPDLAAAPLLRDSSDSEASLLLASSRFSLSSSSSSGHDHDDFPRHSLDSVDPTPRPRIRLVRSHPQAPQPHPPVAASASSPAPASAPARAAHSPARRRPSPSPPPPPPPSVVSVDSPRMNASGKIVFQGLERSSSSPAGSAQSSMRSRSRSRVMDRSYSAGVRATPVVLNVPVCSRPVFGFFKDKKEAAARDAASARARSALGRRMTTGGSAPAAGAVGGRDLGSGN